MSNIRNFVIIAHVDHGKSTLADRFLEITETVPARQIKEQYLDQLELERERGITIKMAPVRMVYQPPTNNLQLTTNNKLLVNGYELSDSEYILNLIDTPGHSDFSYEVSRALAAVEGAILLVDATQGIQAQTLANFRAAKKMGLQTIGAVNKIDLFVGRENDLKKTVGELAHLLEVNESEIFLISGKTGQGVNALLEAIIEKIPPPSIRLNRFSNEHESAMMPARALIFDSFYDNHKGVIASVRIFDGKFKNTDTIQFIATETRSKIKELGFFTPELKPATELNTGEIGYIATGIKEPHLIKIGDTLIANRHKLSNANTTNKNISEIGGKLANITDLALPGYKEPKPVVFVSLYPEESEDFDLLKKSLEKLHLNDSALTISPDENKVLGRGFKVGFLGRLHFEITGERLKREFKARTVNTFPSVIYRAKTKKGWIEVVKPEDLPQDFEEIWEPMINIEIIVPPEYLNNLFPLQILYRLKDIRTENFEERVKIKAKMPLMELVSDFDDKLKSATQGFASFSYEFIGYEPADIVRVDILVARTMVPGLSRFIPKATLDREARQMVERLKELLPREQFAQSIQAVAGGRVIAREDIPALRKDVTGYLYGGDRTRKMKLWKKQAEGKKKLKERATAKIPPEVFRELLKR
jgi:GTP-binding protein LepA